MNTVNVSAVRERLISEHKTLGSWRSVAAEYGCNVAYVYDLATKGKIPGNRDIRVRLGLERGPKPKAKGLVDTACSQMATATRRALEGWKS